ncbi:hypothetical protein Tco_1278837, partial [Tanacetum coccineum]
MSVTIVPVTSDKLLSDFNREYRVLSSNPDPFLIAVIKLDTFQHPTNTNAFSYQVIPKSESSSRVEKDDKRRKKQCLY